jgi:zinc D-Ala-D-Ala carboxypeptidase
MTQLSANFSLKEFTKSDTAIRFGLDNTPTPEIVARLQKLVDNIIQPVRNHYGKSVTVNSGYRAPDVNAAVKGSRTSDHCKGQAADIEIVGVANGDLAQYIIDNYKFTQVILEFYKQGIPDSGWVHVSYDENNLKCEVLTAVMQDGKTVYLKGLHK